ncbi:hypothetical protein RMQ97_09845 [Maricaulis sp. D1M11]|uniref:hypothetical protein n=1 Tax=Maricaulis sp. D1M11 TaxID=3076117 RepID=UPI0039B3DC9B
MKSGVRTLFLAIMVGVSACVPASNDRAQSLELIEDTQVTAVVTDLGEGQFEVEYRFAEPHDVFVFARSQTEYRTEAWRPIDTQTPVERVAGMDALIFDRPVSSARFHVQARPDLDYAGYAHFTAFSDGGLVLFTGQFELLLAQSRESIEAMQGDLNQFDGVQPRTGVAVRSLRPMIAHGRSIAEEAVDVSLGGGSFVYIGDGDIETTPNYAGLIDPGTPDWLKTRFESDMAYLFDRLETGWGYGLDAPATLMFAFGGHDHPGFSNKGGVQGRQLMIRSSGEALREEDPFIHAYLLWFFAHETVHLFQNVKGARLAESFDSWIHEGAANAMANRIMAEQGDSAAAYLQYSFSNALETCVASLENGNLQGAEQRGEFDAYYACGEFVALILDAGTPQGDLYDIWNRMLDLAVEETEEDTVPEYDRETYLRAAIDLGLDSATADWIRVLTTYPLADPRVELITKLEEMGLNPQFDDENRLTAITYPDA